MKNQVFMILFSTMVFTNASFAQDKNTQLPYSKPQPTSHLTDVNAETHSYQNKPPSIEYSDAVVTANIKRGIAADTALSPYKINITTQDGVVTLDGTVKSDTDASMLVQIAQSTNGVRDVNTNALKIENSNQPFTDIMITAKIKGTYLREKLSGKDVPAVNVSVETNNGVVYLSGSVGTKEQANNAIKFAKSVAGVKAVRSRIKVVGS